MVTSDETQIQIFADWPIESLSNDDDDAEDDAKQKMKLYFTTKIRDCLDLLLTPMALKTCSG